VAPTQHSSKRFGLAELEVTQHRPRYQASLSPLLGKSRERRPLRATELAVPVKKQHRRQRTGRRGRQRSRMRAEDSHPVGQGSSPSGSRSASLRAGPRESAHDGRAAALHTARSARSGRNTARGELGGALVVAVHRLAHHATAVRMRSSSAPCRRSPATESIQDSRSSPRSSRRARARRPGPRGIGPAHGDPAGSRIVTGRHLLTRCSKAAGARRPSVS